MTFNLNDETYHPYRKPGNPPLLIHVNSNHPPAGSISTIKRISKLSCNTERFAKAAPIYVEAIRKSGFKEPIKRAIAINHKPRIKTRKRNIIWFNPPYSMNVATNVGRTFLELVNKHFPAGNQFNVLFNKNNMKVSYGCMENMAQVIKRHNNKILYNNHRRKEEACQCRNQNECLLMESKKEPSPSGPITSNSNTVKKNYIGMTEGSFETRFNNHTSSFNHKKYSTKRTLSKYVWKLKDNNEDYSIKWSIQWETIHKRRQSMQSLHDGETVYFKCGQTVPVEPKFVVCIKR